MPVTVKAISLAGLQFTNPQMMEIVGNTARRIARERIMAGLGTDGQPMPAYSKEWAKNRADRGRVIDHRTLSDTGTMLRDRRVLKIADTSVTVGWSDEESALKASGNEDRTPFVQPTAEEHADLGGVLNQLVRRNLRNQLAAARAAKG